MNVDVNQGKDNRENLFGCKQEIWERWSKVGKIAEKANKEYGRPSEGKTKRGFELGGALETRAGDGRREDRGQISSQTG